MRRITEADIAKRERAWTRARRGWKMWLLVYVMAGLAMAWLGGYASGRGRATECGCAEVTNR